MALKKRILGILLIVSMLVTYMPNIAYAAFEVEPSNKVLTLKATAKGQNTVKLSWDKIKGATHYVVYGGQVGRWTNPINKHVESNKLTVTKIGKKALKPHTKYNFTVSAFKGDTLIETATGSESWEATVLTGNTYGKYGNVKTFKFKGTEKSIKTFNLFGKGKINLAKKAKVVQKIYGNKKLITGRGMTFNPIRYKSNDPTIAKVSTKGVVTAVGNGTAFINILSVNGHRLRVKIVNKAVTLKFNANGGTGSMEDFEVPYNKETKLPESKYTKDGKGIIGWAREKNGAVKYNDEESLDIKEVSKLYAEDNDGNIDLYAVWAGESTPQGTGGTGGSDGEITQQQKTQIINEAYPDMATDMLDTLYKSISDNSSMPDSTKEVIIQKIIEYKEHISSDAEGKTPQEIQEMVEQAMAEAYTQIITLVASGNSAMSTPLYVVTFKANGPNGHGVDMLRIVKEGEKVVDVPSLAATGYKFLGWYDLATGGATVDFSSKTITSDTTVYAHWKAQPGGGQLYSSIPRRATFGRWKDL